MDLGQLNQGRELLHRCLQLAPCHSHACVALALGYQRAGDLLRAKEYTMQALAADPRNPMALKNLGAILGKEGDSLRALYYLRQSLEIDPQDRQTVYWPCSLVCSSRDASCPLDGSRLEEKHFDV